METFSLSCWEKLRRQRKFHLLKAFQRVATLFKIDDGTLNLSKDEISCYVIKRDRDSFEFKGESFSLA